MPRLEAPVGDSTGGATTPDQAEPTVAPIEIQEGVPFRPFEGITLDPINPDPDQSYQVIAKKRVIFNGIPGEFQLITMTEYHADGALPTFPLGPVRVKEIFSEEFPRGNTLSMPLQIDAVFFTDDPYANLGEYDSTEQERDLEARSLVVRIGSGEFRAYFSYEEYEEDLRTVHCGKFEEVGDIWLPMDPEKLATIEAVITPHPPVDWDELFANIPTAPRD